MKKQKIILTISLILIIVAVILIELAIIKLNQNQDVDIENPTNDQNQEENYVQEESTLNIFEPGEPLRIEEEKEYKGLTISNIEFQMIDQRSCEVSANVRNETDKLIEMQNIIIKTFDADGNLLDTFGAQIDSVEPGGHTELFTALRVRDVSNIARIEIEEN